MNTEHFDKFAKVAAALKAAEKEHPNSRALKVLHAHASTALDSVSQMFTEDQYVALGGGTPKTPGD